MNDIKKITVQEVKTDALPIIIIYHGVELKEYLLKDNKDHTGLQLIRKEY